MKIAHLAGLTLDDWQEWALARSMGIDGDGHWAAFEAALIVPRQSGKTEVIVARLMAFLFSEIDQGRLAVYTAHEYKTAREVFLRFCELLDPPADGDPALSADPYLRGQIKRIRTANGEESFELVNGRRLRFLARTSGSGRGFTGDLVVLDEAHKLSREQMGALLPTLSARPNPQVWYAAAGPAPDSEPQLSLRERAEAGGGDLFYAEWSMPDDADPEDESVWLAVSPASPHRIGLKFLRRAREALGAAEFAREHLCLHDFGRVQAVIDPDVWTALGDDDSTGSDPVTFAVDAPPDRSTATITVAALRDDERTHVEIVDRRPGVEWAGQRLVELARKNRRSIVVLSPTSAASSLIPTLLAAKIEPVFATGRDMAQACGHFHDLVVGDRLRWRPGEHTAELAASVNAGRKRTIGETWIWGRPDAAADISLLVSATLACWGTTHPARRKGGARIVGV